MTPLSFMLSKMPTSSPENGVSTQHVQVRLQVYSKLVFICVELQYVHVDNHT